MRIVLENTRIWTPPRWARPSREFGATLGLILQALIQQQSAKIRKGYRRLRPEITNYFWRHCRCRQTVTADPEKLKSFLTVTDKVINLDGRDKANQFFVAARDFFEHGVLFFDKTSQLYARDDDFAFDYISDVVIDDPWPATLPIRSARQPN